jgi:formate dehydrogenase subunit gamma
LAQMVHGVVGLVFIAIMLAHIYIGTIGMQGAFQAMGRGEVDVNWARQHHSLWLEKQAKKGRVRGPAPAE